MLTAALILGTIVIAVVYVIYSDEVGKAIVDLYKRSMRDDD